MENNSIIKNLGLMLDCSRNAVMTVPQLKLLMQRIRIMGYNQFFLYIEDTYEVDNEPYFGYLRGRYSQEELREIEDVAISLGMEFVPCIQVLGHLNALMQWPRFQEIQDSGDCLLVGSTETYNLIEKMIFSLRKCLRTKKIHIGMDEAYHMGTGKYLKLHADEEPKEPIDIFLTHLEQVCMILKKYDFEPLMWGDMFFRALAKNNQTFFKEKAPIFTEELKKRIPKNLTTFAGDYNWHSKGAEQRFADLAEWMKSVVPTENLVMLGALWKWQSFSPRNHMSIDTTRNAIKACEMCGVKSYLTTSWGDDGSEASTYSMLPTIVYTACLAQGISDENEIKKKFNEWTGENYDDFMLFDKLDDTPEYAEGIIVNKSKFHLYNDCFLSKLDSTVAPYDASDYARYAKLLSEAAERSKEYKYIFDMYAKLASVLSIKADIGIRSHEIYKSGNRTALCELISDYKKMIARTREFYESMRTRWYTENKPHGFEIQDIRIGGLITRMENCCRTFEDYRDGKIDKIYELEDEIIPFREDQHYPRNFEFEETVHRVRVDRWADMVSTNTLVSLYGAG